MTDDPVTTKLAAVFCEVFDDDELKIRRDMTADDVEGWDSMKHLRLILTVEREFGVRLPSTKVSNLKSVGDLIDLIRSCPPK
jgi:acyl carrier protein